MSRMPLYRSLIVSVAALAVLAFAGCEDMSKSHEVMKAEQTNKWNLTRIGVIYQLAEQQYKVGDYDKCTETLKEAFATKAPFAPIYILAAKVDIERGNLELAANGLNTAIRYNANDPEPYYLLGVLYQRWQKLDVACDYYQQAWDRKLDEARYMLAVVEMQISLGHLDVAQSTLESKVVYFEQSAAVRVALARVATLKNDYPTACKYYREAVTLTPEDKNLHRSYVEALVWAKQYAVAVPQLEEMRKHASATERPNIVMMLGQSYLGLHRTADARNCFQEVIREQPDNMAAYANLGQACVLTGELNLAFSAAKKIIRTEPANVQGLILLAVVQQKQKKWSDAQDTLEKACRIAPSDATILCMLGVNAQQLGKQEAALGFYEKAVQAHPNDSWAVELLSRAKPAHVQSEPAKSDTADNATRAPANASVSDLGPTADAENNQAPAVSKAP